MFCVLRVIDGPAQGSQLFLGCNQRLTIGRLSTADFSIPSDQHLSRNHLAVESDESSFRVIDMGSSNGTFVNNSPVSRIEICSGDIIRAGKSVFEVQLKNQGKKPVQTGGAVTDALEPVKNRVPSRTLKSGWDEDLTERNSPSLSD